MTWKSFHHQGETLRAVITTADSRRDGLLPMDVAGVADTFGDELTLLGALQLKWHTRLAGRIESELMSQPLDLAEAVQRAWASTADELPGVRLVLDRYRAEPLDETMALAMAKATEKERQLLAVMAGQAGVGDVGGLVGARIEEQARVMHRGIPVLPTDEQPGTFLERLRAVLAA